jgi:hypothetical protein
MSDMASGVSSNSSSGNTNLNTFSILLICQKVSILWQRSGVMKVRSTTVEGCNGREKYKREKELQFLIYNNGEIIYNSQ